MAGGQLDAGGLEGDADRLGGGGVAAVALADVIDLAIGMDIRQNDAEIITGGAGGAVEFNDRLPSDRQCFPQGWRSVGEDIGAVIEGGAGHGPAGVAGVAAVAGDGPPRVVDQRILLIGDAFGGEGDQRAAIGADAGQAIAG